MSTTVAVEAPAPRYTTMDRPVGDTAALELYKCVGILAGLAGELEQLGRWLVAPEGGWGGTFDSEAERNTATLTSAQDIVRQMLKVAAKIGSEITVPVGEPENGAPLTYAAGDRLLFDGVGMKILSGSARLFSYGELEGIRGVANRLVYAASVLDIGCSLIGRELEDEFASEKERDHQAAGEMFRAARSLMRDVADLAVVLGALKEK